MSAQSAEPMGETPKGVRIRDFLMQVLAEFPDSQRALLKIVSG